ncbi:MAG: type II secretion system F family protein [Actinobacteria bacterium]|nr:type II secretion system F family protein [Actinomycetota bacterium]
MPGSPAGVLAAGVALVLFWLVLGIAGQVLPGARGMRALRRLDRQSAETNRHRRREGSGWLQIWLDRAGWRLKALEFGLLWLVGAVLAALAGYSGGGLPLALIATGLGGAIPWWMLQGAAHRRRRAMEAQFETLLVRLAAAHKAGLSLVQGLQGACAEAGAPLRDELERALQEYEVGVPLMRALNGLEHRVRSEEVGYFLAALEVNRMSGGGLTEVLSHLAESVRSRRLLRLELDTKTTEARHSAVVIAVMPALLAAYFYRFESQLFSPLLDHPLGRVASGAAVLLWIAGVLISRQIVSVKEVG